MTTRRRHPQVTFSDVTLFGGALPPPEQLMDRRMRKMDEALEDPALVDAVVDALCRRRPQSARRGRSSTPAEVVLRLLVLKHLRDWSLNLPRFGGHRNRDYGPRGSTDGNDGKTKTVHRRIQEGRMCG